MARREIVTQTTSLEKCILELILSIINVGIGVLCAFTDKPELITAFYIAILIQALDNLYEYLCFMFGNKNKIKRWFRNIVAIMALLQGFAFFISLWLIFASITNDYISYLLCGLVALPVILLVYELVYHMTK